MTPTLPRLLALSVLEDVERREAYAEPLLRSAFDREATLSARDRALVTQLVYGVLRWRNRLDFHLARASRRPLDKLDPRVLQILRLGAFQILFLDRVPDRAAVSESVELTRHGRLNHASGFVNAVLRQVAQQGSDLPGSWGPGKRLSLLFGCPAWLVERWVREHGLEGAERLCRSASRIPQLWLRIDSRRMGREQALARLEQLGIEAMAGAYAPEAVGLTGGDPHLNPLVREGSAVVQDQASQLIAHLVSPEPGWRVLDVCAAPGLKTTHLAALAKDEAEIEAVEIHPHRAEQIRELGNTTRSRGVRVQVADARTYQPDAPFDAVLVDAPCSGLGVLHRTPEAKWRRQPQELESLPGLQAAILDNVAQAVRPGGWLVYATCTTVQAENEDVIDRFLQGHPDFRLSPPAAGPVDWGPFLTAEGYFRTYPLHADGTGPAALDGFFAARLRRQGDER